MVTEDRTHQGNSRAVVMTECPFCKKEIKEQQGFEEHMEDCTELPQ